MFRAPFGKEFFEPIARWIRFRKGIRSIKKRRSVSMVDIGCGPDYAFYHFAKKQGVRFKKYIGVDPLLKSTQSDGAAGNQVKLIKRSFSANIDIPEKVDYVVAFAFLEHVPDPQMVLKKTIYMLKKGGVGIFTTPTPKAKRILEFLALHLKLISAREIREHRQYFDKKSLIALMDPIKSKATYTHVYFEMGLNNLLVVKKNV